MTVKAQELLTKLKRRDRKRSPLRLFRRPETRERVLNDFNQSTIDPVGPVGSQDQQMRVLNEMNELGEQQEQTIRASFPKVTMY